MAKREKKVGNTLYIPVKDYGDDWINRLAAICVLIEKMDEKERDCSLSFLHSKYCLAR